MSSQPPELKRTLGFWQVAIYGVGSMLGAGIYGLIGRAAGTLGNAVWLAFLAAMVAALLTGLSYACVGSRYPRAGGAAYVTERAFGIPLLAYVVGIAVMMSGLTSMATGAQVIAGTILEKAGHAGAGASVWFKPLAIGLVLLTGAIIYRGIRESMWVNVLCTVVEASGLLFIIAAGIRFWGSVDYLELPPPPAEGDRSPVLLVILQGCVLTFFSFIGFEDILNVSEEVKDPERNVPRGLIAAMLIATVIYMGVAITAVSVLPWAELAESAAPLMQVAKKAAPGFGGIDSVYFVITIFAIGNTALLNYFMGSRLLYGMSRQKLLPSPLAKVHPVRRTPYVAIGVLFVIVALLILSGGVQPLAEATVLLLLSVFTVVNGALIRLKLRRDEPPGRFEVPVIVPVLGSLVCLTLIAVRVNSAVQSGRAEDRIAPLVAGGILVAAVVLYRVLKPGKVLVGPVE